LRGGAFVLDAGVFFTPLLIERLKWHPAPDALLYDPSRTLGPREMKVRLVGPYVIDVSEQLRPGLAAGENVGLLKFGSDGSSRLMRVLDELITAGDVTAPVSRAVSELAHRWPIVAIDVDGLPWAKVACPEDLDHAERVMASEIEASLQPITLGAARLASTDQSEVAVVRRRSYPQRHSGLPRASSRPSNRQERSMNSEF
jgi:choline kinase